MTASHPDRLWNRNFRSYWLGIATSALGDALLLVALPFLVLETGSSARALATVVLLGTLPRFLGPVTGSLADRLRLRLPLVGAGVLRAALFMTLALLAMADGLPLWVLYVAAPLNGLMTSFVFAAGMVLVPNLVPRPELARANGIMQAALMGVPLLGMGVAGVLVATLGTAQTVALAAPLLLAISVAALTIDFPTTGAGERASKSFFADMVDAGRHLFGNGPLAFLLVMSLVLNAALNLINVTMPVTLERMGHGAKGFGLFESMLSGGMLLGIAAVGFASKALLPRYQISVSQAMMASGFLVLALGSFVPFLAGGLLLGFGLGFSEVAAVTLLQLAIPDGMRGKVLGMVLTTNAFGLTLGAFVAGGLVDSVDVGPLYLAAGLCIVILGAAWTLLHLRHGRSLDALVETPA